MGISYGGGMLIGCEGLPTEPEWWDEDERGEWRDYLLEDKELDRYSQYYDAGDDNCYFGFAVGDVKFQDMNADWFNKIKKLAIEFEKITGEEPYLIGTQDIY